MTVNRLLLLVLAWAVLGTASTRLMMPVEAEAVTPIRRIAWPQNTPSPSPSPSPSPTPSQSPSPTPTPRPTSIVFQASTTSGQCSLTTGSFFSQGVACNATYTSGDMAWPDSTPVTLTGLDCSEPNDATCTASYTFYEANVTPVSGFTCQHTSPATSCSVTPTPYSMTTPLGVAIRIVDVNNNCGNLRPTCTLFYTVP